MDIIPRYTRLHIQTADPNDCDQGGEEVSLGSSVEFVVCFNGLIGMLKVSNS